MAEFKRGRFVRWIACVFVALGVFSLGMRVFAGREFVLVPWPVALIVFLLGLFVLQQTYENPRNRIARERAEAQLRSHRS